MTPPPGAAPTVRQISALELKKMMDQKVALQLWDVRTPAERSIAQIAGARLLDQAAMNELPSQPHDTLLVFHCHHGGRSQRAAMHFVGLGFTNVCNVTGGIDAWSATVDPSVPRY